MLYLSSPVKASDMPRLAGVGFGLMLTPTHGDRRQVLRSGIVWAADNGCYSQGDKFVLSEYLAWLDLHFEGESKCLFATAPDVVGDARATWERSKDILPMLAALGYSPALVAQDGLEDFDVHWDSFDALFIGGTTEWKLSRAAFDLIAEAKLYGKWVHMGRVNSLRRLRTAYTVGCDSADGTTIAFNPGRYIPEVRRWLLELQMQREFTA